MFDPASSTYTYLLADGGEAVLIDPVFEQVRRDGALIEELGLHAGRHAGDPCPCRSRDRRMAAEAALGSEHRVSAQSGAEGADRYLSDGDRISFGMRSLGVRATPGHTAGCVTYVLDGEEMAFTGDCLLIRGCGRTDFQDGDPAAMYRSVHEQIFSLPDECLLYPAHDYRGLTVTSVAEERALQSAARRRIERGRFLAHMKNLGSPIPSRSMWPCRRT